MYASSETKSKTSACGTSTALATSTAQYRRRGTTRSSMKADGSIAKPSVCSARLSPPGAPAVPGSVLEAQALLDPERAAAGGTGEDPGADLVLDAREHLGVGVLEGHHLRIGHRALGPDRP